MIDLFPKNVSSNFKTLNTFHQKNRRTSQATVSSYMPSLPKPVLAQNLSLDFMRFSKGSARDQTSQLFKLIEKSQPVFQEKPGNILSHTFDDQNRMTEVVSQDGFVHFSIDYGSSSRTIINHVTQEVLVQTFDDENRLIQEIFPNGQKIQFKYEGAKLTQITLPDQSTIEQAFHQNSFESITKKDAHGKVVYKHSYRTENQKLFENPIGNLGEISQYSTGKKLITDSKDFHMEEAFHQKGMFLRIFDNKIIAQSKDVLTHSPRLLGMNQRVIAYNGFYCTYDEKGRLVEKKSKDQTYTYQYDALDRLSSFETKDLKVEYTYDFFGRRLSKTKTVKNISEKETFLFQGDTEIGVFDENHKLKHLRVLGKGNTPHIRHAIAIESHGQTYAPIYSAHHNILQLINIDTQEKLHYEDLKPFGDNLKDLNPITPWIFACKHYDLDTNLMRFEHRLYDPSLKQWITQDPDPEAYHDDLYSYCNHNPLRFFDPDGRLFISIPLTLGVKPAIAAILTGLVVQGVAEGAELLNEKIESKRGAKKEARQNGVLEPLYASEVEELEQGLEEELTVEELDEIYEYIEVEQEDLHYYGDADEEYSMFEENRLSGSNI